MNSIYFLGKRLENLRITSGVTMEELSKSLMLTKDMINNLEKGKVRIDLKTLIKYADIFKVTTDYILGEATNSSINKYYESYKKLFNKKILENKKYYWIYYKNKDNTLNISCNLKKGHKTWTLEPRIVIPKNVIKNCAEAKEELSIINNIKDCNIFMLLGENALIIEELFIKYFKKELLQTNKIENIIEYLI